MKYIQRTLRNSRLFVNDKTNLIIELYVRFSKDLYRRTLYRIYTRYVNNNQSFRVELLKLLNNT